MGIYRLTGDLRRASAALSLVAGMLLSTPAVASIWDDAKKLLSGDDTETVSGESLSDDQVGAGLKEALKVGTGRVVRQLGATDGFNADPAIRIPLPENLATVRSALDTVGMSSTFDDLELRLNRAAELATPKAKSLFLDAIRQMTLADVQSIYAGPDDAATQYFRARMSEPLAAEMAPVVDASLDEVGAVQVYGAIMEQYNALPFVPPVDSDLTGYVVGKGMDGIFHYLASEEAAIRNDPVARTTDLLQQVFGR